MCISLAGKIMVLDKHNSNMHLSAIGACWPWLIGITFGQDKKNLTFALT